MDFIESFNIKHIPSDASSFSYKDKLIINIEIDEAKYVAYKLMDGKAIDEIIFNCPSNHCSITINLL